MNGATSNSPEKSRTDRLTLLGLLLLCAVPVLSGFVRLTQLASQAAITPDNARFFASPLPIVIHILSVAVFAILGAIQFTSGSPDRNRGWHRAAGKIALAAGLAAANSGLVLTLTYPPADYSGPLLFAMRLAVGASMNAFILMALRSIRRREFGQHGNWMIRAYALGMGAGTQFFTHIPWLLFPAIRGEGTRALIMGLGWAFNIVAAEWIIRRNASALRLSRSSRPRLLEIP
jgi:hypothetical protein